MVKFISPVLPLPEVLTNPPKSLKSIWPLLASAKEIAIVSVVASHNN